jgi:hypothetical protein
MDEMTATARIWHPPLIFEIADHEIVPRTAQLVISSRHPKRAAPFKRGDRGDLSRRTALYNTTGGGECKKEGGGVFAERPLVSLTITSSFLLASTQKMHPMS